MTKLVAVYGSLRQGLHNHRVLGDSPMVGMGSVNGFGLYSLGAYPAISSDGKHVPVVVELYEVDNISMSRLDRLEGYPSYYNRRIVDVHTEDGIQKAWIYFQQGEPSDIFIESGDWTRYLIEKVNR